MTRLIRPLGPAFDHRQPIARIDTLPIGIFLLCLLAMSLSFYSRSTHALVVDLLPPNTDGFDTRLGLAIDKIVAPEPKPPVDYHIW